MLRLAIGGVTALKTGLWEARLGKKELGYFNNVSVTEAHHAIVVISGAHFDQITRTLTVQPSDCRLIATGATESVIFVSTMLGDQERIRQVRQIVDDVKIGKADLPESAEKFIANCARFGLSPTLVTATQLLLSATFSEHQFELVEGKQRKWTSAPNFIALTIQNRNRELLVSVKGDPDRMSYKTIKPKVSRRPYCEFHFKSPDQLDEVIDIVRMSIRYKWILGGQRSPSPPAPFPAMHPGPAAG